MTNARIASTFRVDHAAATAGTVPQVEQTPDILGHVAVGFGFDEEATRN